MKTVKINGQAVQYAEFNTLAAAQRFADNANGINFILLGDNELFWVASGRSKSRLVKAGYQLA